MKTLVEMLTWARPYGSAEEAEFVKRYVAPVAPFGDAFGNRWAIVGEGAPRVMWSCHTDTVDAKGGRKKLAVDCDGRVLSLAKGAKAGMCLGADDGAGVWLLREMIAAEIPGLYLFHRGEERGGLGSRWIIEHNSQLLAGIELAIAFDRKGTDSIITHQLGERCCSERFARELADGLNATGHLSYISDQTGMFTDTANYTHLVSECTNLSVGYEREHGPTETLDVEHLATLRDALLGLDVDKLGAYRDPAPPWQDEPQWQPRIYRKPQSRHAVNDNLLDLVYEYPEIAAKLLAEAGATEWDFQCELDATREENERC